MDITLLEEGEARIEVICRRRYGGQVPPTLAETIAQNTEQETGSRCLVTVEVVPLLTYESPRYGLRA